MNLSDDVRQVAADLEPTEDMLDALGKVVGGRNVADTAKDVRNARAKLDDLAAGVEDLENERDALRNDLDDLARERAELQVAYEELVVACADDPSKAKSADAQLRLGTEPTEVVL